MTRSAILSGVVMSIGLGLLITVLTTSSAVLSFEVWVASTLAWFGVVVAAHLLTSAPGAEAELRPIWRRAKLPEPAVYRPTVLASTDRVIAGSLRQPRLFHTRLRPRLDALQAQTNRHPSELGDAAWLVDGDTGERVPTLTDLDAFLDALENS